MPFNYVRVIDAVDRAVPPMPSQPDARSLEHHRKVVMIGAATEMCSPRPSHSELAEAIGCARVTVIKCEREWFAMRWEDRYAWLRLIQGRLTSEKNRMDAALRGRSDGIDD